MSAIQEAAQKTTEFYTKIKQAKNAAGYTNQSLADASGLSLSTVAKILSGASGDLKLPDAVALALTLGLSLDELCGLIPPVPADEALLARVHELELESAAKDGQITELRTRLKAIHPLVYGLCALCVTLAMALAAYLLGDSQYPEIGLIRWGEITAPAWILIGIIVASVVVTVLLVCQVTHPRRHKNG